MFTQLNPPIPLHVIGKGDGYAIAVIDYSQEHNLVWVTALNESGEIWCAPNPIVRLGKNWTMGRSLLDEDNEACRCNDSVTAHPPYASQPIGSVTGAGGKSA
jgi:hypothetical protein